jgi:HAMP domain-containing protein
MSTVAKILVVLNFLLAGYFLSSASSFLAQEDNFKKELAAEQAAHETTKQQKDDEISSLRGRLNSLQTRSSAPRPPASPARTRTCARPTTS